MYADCEGCIWLTDAEDEGYYCEFYCCNINNVNLCEKQNG